MEFHCIVCGKNSKNDNKREAYNANGGGLGSYIECSVCGSESVCQNAINNAVLYEDRSSTNYPTNSHLILMAKQAMLKYTVKKYVQIKDGSVIVDYGCGGGEFSCALAMLGKNRVVAVDLQHHRPLALESSIEYLDVDAYAEFRNADYIFMRHVVEHLNNPLCVLKLLKKTLKTGGYLVAEFPAKESAWKKIMKSKWPGYFYPYHYSVISVNGAKRLFEEAGYKIISIKTVEPPIIGLWLMYNGLNRNLARYLSIFLYPIQWAISKICHSSEATLIFAKKID